MGLSFSWWYIMRSEMVVVGKGGISYTQLCQPYTEKVLPNKSKLPSWKHVNTTVWFKNCLQTCTLMWPLYISIFGSQNCQIKFYLEKINNKNCLSRLCNCNAFRPKGEEIRLFWLASCFHLDRWSISSRLLLSR